MKRMPRNRLARKLKKLHKYKLHKNSGKRMKILMRVKPRTEKATIDPFPL